MSEVDKFSHLFVSGNMWVAVSKGVRDGDIRAEWDFMMTKGREWKYIHGKPTVFRKADRSDVKHCQKHPYRTATAFLKTHVYLEENGKMRSWEQLA